MVKKLVVIAGPDRGNVYPLPEKDSLLLGRSRATESRLSDPHVSRVHCEVMVHGKTVSVSDFDSAGGTFVNDQRITKHRLKPGDVIRIGQTQLAFHDDNAGEASTVPPPAPGKAAARGAEELQGLVGKTFAHYEVGQVLAQGRSGLVFHARDTKEDRPVALKVLVPEFAKNDQQKQRFVRAMKTVLPLRHPNLVALYAAGKAGPYCWMAMEYVEGENLTQVIQRIGTAGMLDWRRAFQVAVHVGRALDFAHGHRIMHRNVTPMNILVRTGHKLAKLGDLMLAKALEGNLATPITRPGELVGDAPYLSPERTHGTADIDGRSDIYGLGATVYALLTGRPPCEGATLAETVTAIRKNEPVRPKKYQLAIPDQFEAVVLKMLAKRSEDRYQTAADLLVELERMGQLQGVTV
jgi:serine/threonine protein kinase